MRRSVIPRVIAGAQATLSGSTLQCTAAPNFGTYPAASGASSSACGMASRPFPAIPSARRRCSSRTASCCSSIPTAWGNTTPATTGCSRCALRAFQPANTHRCEKAGRHYLLPRSSGRDHLGQRPEEGVFPRGQSKIAGPSCSRSPESRGCCTCRVGDGVNSFGDFTSIQAAIDSLPAEGGEVCILPGLYYEHVRILNRRDIVIHGCGWQTRVASPSLRPKDAPVVESQAPAGYARAPSIPSWLPFSASSPRSTSSCDLLLSKRLTMKPGF